MIQTPLGRTAVGNCKGAFGRRGDRRTPTNAKGVRIGRGRPVFVVDPDPALNPHEMKLRSDSRGHIAAWRQYKKRMRNHVQRQEKRRTKAA